MTIINPEPNESGQHTIESQSHRAAPCMPGYIEVPDNLREAVFACRGYCDLVIENGILTEVTPREIPPPDPPPVNPSIEKLLERIVELEQRVEELEGGRSP